MKHLGDITKINGAEIAPVDVIIGGSPCQDLSIAGKRAGLAGARSGLFMEQIRIVKEMRDATDGDRPRFVVWENVPGAFSSNKGKDFAAVVEETIRVVEPKAPGIDVPKRGWPTWGQYRDVDGRWSVAWRVLDAQYWGVPQRRRRIALIADFGGGAAGEILFNRTGVQGDSEPGGTAREGTAAGAESGAGNPGKRITAAFKPGNSATARSIGYSVECAPTLDSGAGGNKPTILDMTHACDVVRDCGETVPTLQSRMGTGGNQTPCVFGLDCRNGRETEELCGTLQSKSNGGYSLNFIPPVRIARTYANSSFGEYCESDDGSPCLRRDYKDATNLVLKKFVRRLTPLECERLQGYPDGWTDIGDWTDGKGKKHQTSDAARYKALGNSIALPPWKWVLKRLCAEYERDAMMGSLFDGIGGFPLIWERMNGKGSCLWASEIEEFCIAVTKRRFE